MVHCGDLRNLTFKCWKGGKNGWKVIERLESDWKGIESERQWKEVKDRHRNITFKSLKGWKNGWKVIESDWNVGKGRESG